RGEHRGHQHLGQRDGGHLDTDAGSACGRDVLRRRDMRTCLVVALLGALAIDAAAAPPTTFTVQGVLRNNAGQLQSMMLTVTLTFYDAQIGGNQLATFADNMVMAQSGLFTVTISDPQYATHFGAAAETWMELTISTPSIGTYPRQRVTSQLYSLQSKSA